MRFLVDQCLSVELAEALTDAGHDVTHLRNLGMQRAKDPEVLELAQAEDRVLLSADTDFGALLASTGATVLRSCCSGARPGANPVSRRPFCWATSLRSPKPSMRAASSSSKRHASASANCP